VCSVLIPVLSYTSVLKGSTVLCRVQVEMTNCSVRAHRLRAAAAAKHAVRCGSIAGMTAASWGPLPGLTLACMLVAIAHAHSCGPLPGLRSLSIDLDDGGRLVLGADCSFSVFHSRQGSPSNLQGCPPSTRPACRRWGQRDGLDLTAPPAHAAGGTARRPTAPGLLVGLGCRDSARPVRAGRPDVLPVPPVFAIQGGQSDCANSAAVLPRAPAAVLSGSSVRPWLQQGCWVCELPACVPAGVQCAWVRTRNCCRTRVIAAPPHVLTHLTACLGRAGGSTGRRAQSGGPHVPGRRATSGAVGTVILGAWVGSLLHANLRAAGTAPKHAPAAPRRDGFPVVATVTAVGAEVRTAAAAPLSRRPRRRPGTAAVPASRSADSCCVPSGVCAAGVARPQCPPPALLTPAVRPLPRAGRSGGGDAAGGRRLGRHRRSVCLVRPAACARCQRAPAPARCTPPRQGASAERELPQTCVQAVGRPRSCLSAGRARAGTPQHRGAWRARSCRRGPWRRARAPARRSGGACSSRRPAPARTRARRARPRPTAAACPRWAAPPTAPRAWWMRWSRPRLGRRSRRRRRRRPPRRRRRRPAAPPCRRCTCRPTGSPAAPMCRRRRRPRRLRRRRPPRPCRRRRRSRPRKRRPLRHLQQRCPRLHLHRWRRRPCPRPRRRLPLRRWRLLLRRPRRTCLRPHPHRRRRRRLRGRLCRRRACRPRRRWRRLFRPRWSALPCRLRRGRRCQRPRQRPQAAPAPRAARRPRLRSLRRPRSRRRPRRPRPQARRPPLRRRRRARRRPRRPQRSPRWAQPRCRAARTPRWRRPAPPTWLLRRCVRSTPDPPQTRRPTRPPRCPTRAPASTRSPPRRTPRPRRAAAGACCRTCSRTWTARAAPAARRPRRRPRRGSRARRPRRSRRRRRMRAASPRPSRRAATRWPTWCCRRPCARSWACPACRQRRPRRPTPGGRSASTATWASSRRRRPPRRRRRRPPRGPRRPRGRPRARRPRLRPAARPQRRRSPRPWPRRRPASRKQRRPRRRPRRRAPRPRPRPCAPRQPPRWRGRPRLCPRGRLRRRPALRRRARRRPRRSA